MATAPETTKSKSLLADFGLLYAAAIWGLTFVMVKSALSDIDPVILVGYRFLLAGFLLLPVLLIMRRKLLLHIKHSLLLGTILILLYVPQTIGLGITTASNSAFITGLFVAFVPFFLLTLFRKRPSVWEIVASIVSLVGLWVLTGGMTDINSGDTITLLAAATYALHLLYSDKYIRAGDDPLVLSFQQFIFVGLLSLICGWIFDLPFTVGSSQAFGIILFLAVFPTVSAFVIQLLAQRITRPVKVALIFALEPVFAGLFAWTYGGEPFEMKSGVGGFLIFAAMIIASFSARRPESL